MSFRHRTSCRAASRVGLLLLLAGSLVSCNPELGQIKYPQRKLELGVKYPQQLEAPPDGMVWTATQSGNFLFLDQRPRAAGDMVTVLIEEVADARRGAETELNRNSQMSNTLTGLLTVLAQVYPDALNKELLGGKSTSDFSGGGTTSRTEQLTGTVTAFVKQVLPNGYLYIEGKREILVNREVNYLYISGIVRPADISDENTVLSSRVGEAYIAFNGEGVISEKQGPGYLTRMVDKHNIF